MAYIYDLTDTWNAGGTTFNAIKMNVTDSASAAASKLVTLQTNGTEHFSVTKAGVGYFSSDGLFGLSTASSSRRLRIYGCTATAAASSLQLMTSTSGTGVSDGFTLELDGNEAYVWNYETANIRFGTANTERMRITSAGDVGIGTSSPSAKLDVVTAGAFAAEFNGTNTYIDIIDSTVTGRLQTVGNVFYVGTTAASKNLGFKSGAGVEAMLITSAGNVGIGTSSPGARLHIVNASLANQLRLQDVTADATTKYGVIASGHYTNAEESFSLVMGVSSAASNTLHLGGGVTTLNAASTIAFYTAANNTTTTGTERMRIDSSGNLLIGATATLNNGRFFLNFTGSNGAVFQTDSTATQYQAQFYINGTRVGTISTSGTTTAYNTTSDYRLKNVDGPITNSGAYIDALRPVQGSWKADGARFIGLIAHEVQEVSETLIATGVKDGEEMQAMDYSAPEIIANLIAEIQSLRARVAQLEGN